jgi:hypothetical protein
MAYHALDAARWVVWVMSVGIVAVCCLSLRSRHACSFKNVESACVSDTYVVNVPLVQYARGVYRRCVTRAWLLASLVPSTGHVLSGAKLVPA